MNNNGEINEEPPMQKSIKRGFFDNIKEIIKIHLPNIRVFDTDLSRLFFRRARTLKDSHLKGDYKHRRLDLSTLFRFIYKMRFLSTEEFAEKITDIESIDKKTLKKITFEVETFIEEFIFANPYDIKYIGDFHYTGTRHLKPEYDLTLKIWIELSKAKKEPILLKHARKIMRYESFGRINRFGEPTRGKVYSWIGLINMLKELTRLLPSDSYAITFEHVWGYIEQRGLYPVLPRVYHPSWYTISTVKFHVIMLIIRDLGLDILNLKPIKTESFKKTHKMDSFTYERHHIFINDKMSIDVNRLALVMHKNHNDLEGKTDLVHDLIQRRIDLTFECPQYYKTNLKSWRERWQVYLKRRGFLVQNGIGNFIKEYFTDDDGNNYIFERFFKDVPEGNIEREIRIMMQKWIAKNRPAPILNAHIINRLFCGTRSLLTSGFIQYKS